jgi:hypothetical protein
MPTRGERARTSNRTAWSSPSAFARELAARIRPGLISRPMPRAPLLPAANDTLAQQLRMRRCVRANFRMNACGAGLTVSFTLVTVCAITARAVSAGMGLGFGVSGCYLPSPHPMSSTQSTPALTSASCINSSSISSGQCTSGHMVPACVPHPECLS